MVIGSGPIVIGQACEFDYSGTQACKALREEGYHVVLLNSNPATIMTDPETAEATYVEPMTVPSVEQIIATERPDALLPTIGGQTALNLAIDLAEAGVLEKYDVQLIGANLEAINKAEDRQLFRAAMDKIGLKMPVSGIATNVEEAREIQKRTGLPTIIRPSFTMGGSGGGICEKMEDFDRMAQWALDQSPTNQILVEQSVVGWKEYELEVMRDRADNVVVICSIENFDAMGVHTGDSITVAPAQTLTDREYQEMRDAAAAIMREIGVETGGSNVQFGVDPKDGTLVVIDKDERVSAANDPARALFGEAMVGRHYITVLRQPTVLDCVEAALAGGKPASAQFLSRDTSGDTTFQVQATPFDTPGLSGVMLAFEDVSHVQAATQMRRDFVANVSHELRSPLTAVLGFIETLRGPAKDDAAARERFLEIMEREATRMSRLIKDLLSLSKVETEERQRPTTPVDVAGLVTSATMSLGPLAKENGVEITVEGIEDTVLVPGDADQILQVLTNLMENAIKYSNGSVRVELTTLDRDETLRAPAVRIEVADDGDGIEAIHIPRLTERFYRVDSHRSREMGGTGLGLAIVKHIVNRHRGRLRIESKLGEGTRFIVALRREDDTPSPR